MPSAFVRSHCLAVVFPVALAMYVVIRAFSGTMRRIGMTLSLTALLLVQFLFSSSSSSAIRLLPSQIRADGFPVLGSS